MELKRVVSEETKYVTKKNMNEKILEKNIPSKWKKVGVTAAIFSVMMKCKEVFGYSLDVSVTPTEVGRLSHRTYTRAKCFEK